MSFLTFKCVFTRSIASSVALIFEKYIDWLSRMALPTGSFCLDLCQGVLLLDVVQLESGIFVAWTS